jgi:hypothetical protein
MPSRSPKRPTSANKHRQALPTSLVKERLNSIYGPIEWRPRMIAIDELIFTVLTQNTSDLNAERAYDSLRKALPSWAQVIEAENTVVTEAIRHGSKVDTYSANTRRNPQATWSLRSRIPGRPTTRRSTRVANFPSRSRTQNRGRRNGVFTENARLPSRHPHPSRLKTSRIHIRKDYCRPGTPTHGSAHHPWSTDLQSADRPVPPLPPRKRMSRQYCELITSHNAPEPGELAGLVADLIRVF